jgi:hypothetical protein
MITAYLGKKYGLDFIPGAVDSCVLSFSYYRPTKHFEGNCVEVIRESDYTTKWFSYSADDYSYIDYIGIALFCSGTTGKAKTLVNGSVLVGVQNAIQSDYAKMPIVYESGAFLSDGFKFDINYSSYMNIEKYSAVNIINPPLSSFLNTKSNNLANTGWVFSINRDSGITLQYGLLHRSVPEISFVYGASEIAISRTIPISTYANVLLAWQDKNANGIKMIDSTGNSAQTLNVTFTVYDNMQLGSRSTAIYGTTKTSFYDGNIKSLIIFNSNQYANYTQLAAKF